MDPDGSNSELDNRRGDVYGAHSFRASLKQGKFKLCDKISAYLINKVAQHPIDQRRPQQVFGAFLMFYLIRIGCDQDTNTPGIRGPGRADSEVIDEKPLGTSV